MMYIRQYDRIILFLVCYISKQDIQNTVKRNEISTKKKKKHQTFELWFCFERQHYSLYLINVMLIVNNLAIRNGNRILIILIKRTFLTDILMGNSVHSFDFKSYIYWAKVSQIKIKRKIIIVVTFSLFRIYFSVVKLK